MSEGMTFRVAVFTDGSGTYPAATAVYRELSQRHVGDVVDNWSRQTDVRAIAVVPVGRGGEDR